MLSRVRSLFPDYIGSGKLKSDGNGTAPRPKFGLRRRRTPFHGQIIRCQRVARRLDHRGWFGICDNTDRAGVIRSLLVGPVGARRLPVDLVGLVGSFRPAGLAASLRFAAAAALAPSRALGR